nr:LINE-1 reverse transcriptase isogeny [Tanacetum cinerariifolium]
NRFVKFPSTIGITASFEKNKTHNVERDETREMSESGLVCRLLRNRGRIGVAGSLTVEFLRNLNRRNLFFCHKVLGVSVLSFKGDKVLQEVSTSRFWFKECYLVVKFDRFEQEFHQRVFFDLFVQGFSVGVLLSSRILSTSLLLRFQVSGLLGFNRQKITLNGFLGQSIIKTGVPGQEGAEGNAAERFSNGMSVQILLGGHSTLSLEGGLSRNRDEEKKSGPQSEVPALVEAVACRRRLTIITKVEIVRILVCNS